MKRVQLSGTLFLIAIIFFASCKKDNDTNEFVENAVPVVNAGNSQTTTLPADSVTLTGSAVDSDGSIAAYLWSQVSGPAASIISNPGSASTRIKSLRQGSYIFQLMATDNKGATGVDTVLVTVNPSPIQTLTLNPANNPNEVQVTVLGTQNISGAGGPEISIDAWTSSSQTWLLREYFKFDLTSIPQAATIISANLYLYSHPQPQTGNQVNANFGTSNSLLLQQVSSSWNPGTIGWFNQPSVTTTNQVIIPHTTQSMLDLNLDVKNMISSMVSTNSNYGFGLKLENEVIYNSRIFVSSYNTTYPDKRPKLVVVYQ